MEEIFGDDSERYATYRDLGEMKYLERVLKESLRLYPSVPNISRKMNDDIEIGKASRMTETLCENAPADGSISKRDFFSLKLYDFPLFA